MPEAVASAPATYNPSPASISESVLASVEAELRAEATPSTAPAQGSSAVEAPESQPQEPQTQQPTPATPAPVSTEPAVDPQETERGYLRDKDYRQKTMALAEERRLWEAQREQERQQREQQQAWIRDAQQALSDHNWLVQRAEALRQQANLPQPGQATTAEQVQNYWAQREAALEARFEKKLQDTINRYEIDRTSFELSNQIKNYQQQLLKDFPALGARSYRGIERVITNEALDMKPKTWDEAREFMRAEAAEREKDIKKTLSNHEQAAIMRHSKAQTQPAIEPRGGTAPAVQNNPLPPLGSRALEDLIMADLQAEMAARR